MRSLEIFVVPVPDITGPEKNWLMRGLNADGSHRCCLARNNFGGPEIGWRGLDADKRVKISNLEQSERMYSVETWKRKEPPLGTLGKELDYTFYANRREIPLKSVHDQSYDDGVPSTESLLEEPAADLARLLRSGKATERLRARENGPQTPFRATKEKKKTLRQSANRMPQNRSTRQVPNLERYWETISSLMDLVGKTKTVYTFNLRPVRVRDWQ